MKSLFLIPAIFFTTANAFGTADAEGVAFFESKIRPALVKYCYECHSEAEGKSKGGLFVDSKRALLQGGDSGPAVVPRDSGSLILTAVHYNDPDYEMPPKEKLPAAVIADFETWIEMGAPDPRMGNAPVETKISKIDIEEGRKFWSFVPPRESPLPEVADATWPRTGIDHFILEKLEAKDLAPSPDAAPEVLVRRLYYTLTGLPPSASELVLWTRRLGVELNQDELAALVDHLLASPRFGERWGQHWLDVARYADSTGGDSNNIFPEAWRYRDYVIASFNADKPFDQFVREQLAGDLLPRKSDRGWAENLVATGFLAVGQKLVGETDNEKFRADLVDEQIDATTRAFLGITVSCARCHDHKSDPIPQRNYYALAAVFNNTRTFYGLLEAQARQSSSLVDVTALGLPSGRPPLSSQQLAEMKAERDAAEIAMDEIRDNLGGDESVSRAKLRRSRTQRDRTVAALESYDESGNRKSLVMGTRDAYEMRETRLLLRGDIDHPGLVVAPGFIQVVGGSAPEKFEGSGRLELASWIAERDNPLTSRVAVNRVWHWLFGSGLVRTTDDFGATGEESIHPELLDFLAIRFVENGWSIKRLIRDLVLSRTWQQDSKRIDKQFLEDPDNRLFWRANPRRIEAEAIRDAMLSVSGVLEFGRPLPPLLDAVGEGTVGQNVYEPAIRSIATNARSVYLPRVRNVLPEALALFDVPDSSNVTGSREVTTSPLQALYSLNHPFVRQQAEALAARSGELPAADRLNFIHLQTLGKMPTGKQRQLAQTFSHQFRARSNDSDSVGREAWIAYCHALLCTAEFTLLD